MFETLEAIVTRSVIAVRTVRATRLPYAAKFHAIERTFVADLKQTYGKISLDKAIFRDNVFVNFRHETSG